MTPIPDMIICASCAGSGEGMHPGTRCLICHGMGEVVNWAEPDDHVEYEKDADPKFIDDAGKE